MIIKSVTSFLHAGISCYIVDKFNNNSNLGKIVTHTYSEHEV